MRHHPFVVKLVALTAVLAAAFLCAAVRPVTAAAATPCWKVLLADWYDGRIDKAYPLHCYQDAIHHLPADVQTYSSARDDILRALQSAEARLKKAGKTVTPNTQVPPSRTSTTPTKTGTTPSTRTTSTPTLTSPAPNADQRKGLSRLADKLNPSSPSSLPLPLLVLGALALLLVAAGGAGLILKRRQTPG